MPIIFTDGRRGLFLISSDCQDASFLMHYRVGGEKKGVRRWQNKDGSYTPEGYQHYKEMYGWGHGNKGQSSDPAERFVGAYGAKKNGDVKRTLVNIGRRRAENAKMEGEQSKILKSQEGFGNNDNYKKYCQLDEKISQNYREIEKDLNDLGLTSYEGRFENAAYKVTEDRAVMSQIKRILDNDGGDELHSTAADYNEQSSHCRGLYKTYSEQWGKDHPGKAWDGDGSEFHEELCQKYPEYKKGYDELDRRITKFVKEILAKSKEPEFGSIKGLDKYLNFFDQYGTADSPLYRVGDVKGYAIMAALTNPETSFSEIFPQMFFVDHDKNGEFLQNSVWLAELK